MANISDVIEEFILDILGEESTLSFSRNNLANHFSCAPSQINYVLTTRFNPSRGFVVESQRGGGGYIRLIRLSLDSNSRSLQKILDFIQERMSFKESIDILNLLEVSGFLPQERLNTLKVLFSDKSLSNPFKLEDALRAKMLRELILNLMKEGD